MSKKYCTEADGLLPVDLIHCGVDHLDAAHTLFRSLDPGHYDSAGYLVHIGVELLLKGWLLLIAGKFERTHNLQRLYSELVDNHAAPNLSKSQRDTLSWIDRYHCLRFPDRRKPTEVGDAHWPRVGDFIGLVCRSMPADIVDKLGRIEVGHKAGRVLVDA